MTRSHRLLLLFGAWLIAATSLLCSITSSGDIDPNDVSDIDESENAFATSNAEFTQTANAAEGIVVTSNATATQPAPTATVPDPLDLLSEQSDPTGDTVNCTNNSAATDPASDIVSVKIANPPAGSDHEGKIAIIQMAAFLSDFLDIDFSFALSISTYLATGDITSFLYERHDGIDRIGQEDANHEVIPNTENTISKTPDGSAIQVQLPPGTTKFDVYSFHTPSKDAPENFFCDSFLGIPIPNGS